MNGLSGKKNVEFFNEVLDSSDQIKVLYDVRVREVHRLTELIDSMKKEHDISEKNLKHLLALSQAEKERLNVSQMQLQSLLVSHKEKQEILEKHIVDLESKYSNISDVNNELTKQIETNNIIINDLERKIIVLEKGNRSNFDAVQYESNIKGLIEKHNFELMNLNLENEKINKLNDELVKENNELKVKISQLSQINDENLAKKSEIISRLSKQVDEAQKQCENLMKSSTTEDNIRLQMELKIVKEEKQALMTRLEGLEKEMTRQEEELLQYDSLEKLTSFNVSDSKIDSSDISGKLGAELFKALSGQKAKRQEIKK